MRHVLVLSYSLEEKRIFVMYIKASFPASVEKHNTRVVGKQRVRARVPTRTGRVTELGIRGITDNVMSRFLSFVVTFCVRKLFRASENEIKKWWFLKCKL